jgi:holo-[acyl-carrier protein] synthase
MTVARQPLRDVYDELIRVPLTRPDCPSCRESALRVGTDLQEVAAVVDAVERHGDKYLRRVFTTQELSSSKAGGEVSSPASMASLAARYAVKEAVIKVLRPVQTGIDWREIEVVKEPGGWCTLLLHGGAARMADGAGLSAWAIAFAHDAGMAVATVVARHRCEPRTTASGLERN